MIFSIINLLVEAILVGFYTVFIAFFILTPFFSSIKKKNIEFYFFFFILGILKHYFGYLTGLQAWYCYNKINKTKKLNKTNAPNLLQYMEEGIAFIILSFLIQTFLKIKNIYFLAFLVGFFAHLLADFFGIHTFFCKYLFQ
jgi:hypothetical protein